MPANRYKGFVLAAGFGTRLKPLTNVYPKPLVPFLGSTPLSLALDRIRDSGVAELAVNTHYLALQINEHLKGSSVYISHEPQILGTGGCYPPLKEWLGDDHLIVLNGDVVANFDLKGLIKRYEAEPLDAAMMLLPEVLPGQTPVYYDEKYVLGIGSDQKKGDLAGNFACAQILSPKFISMLPQSGEFDVISKGYKPILANLLKGRIGMMLHRGYWHDLGNPKSYWRAIVETLALLNIQTWISPKAHVASSAEISGNVVIEAGGSVADQAILENCLVLPGGQVARGECALDVIVGPDFTISL